MEVVANPPSPRDEVRHALLRYMVDLGYPRGQAELIREELVDVLEMIQMKRMDYGTANINVPGVHGIAVRNLDKAHRLLNLTTPGGEPASFESTTDTMRDTIGYMLIALVKMEAVDW